MMHKPVNVSSSPTSQARPRAHRIMVCLDGSPLSEVCLPYAHEIAKTFNSEITLIHVMQPRHEHAGSQTADALGWEIARQEARGYLERHQHATAEVIGRPVEVKLEQGHPAERIVALARELDMDLTILGSHGEGGLTAWNLGSTVQQVLSVSRGSVFIAPASRATNVVIPKRILVPLDGSLRTESVLPTAARIAIAYDAELLLVHVVQEPIATSVLRAGEDLELATKLADHLEASARRYLDTLRERMTHDVPFLRTLVLRHASERRCLLDLLHQEHVDLVVLSAHGTSCDPTWSFGSVTAHLLTHSVVPLLVLQDLAPERPLPNELADRQSPALRASYPPEVA